VKRREVFVVFGSTGMYEESYTWPVRAFATKVEADLFVGEAESRAARVNDRVLRIRERERDGALEYEAARAQEQRATRGVWKLLNNLGDETLWEYPSLYVTPIPFGP
jgi:hypothetical protein